MADNEDFLALLQSLGIKESTALKHSIYDLAVDLGTALTTAAALRRWPPYPQNNESRPRSILEQIHVIGRYPGKHTSKHLTSEVPTTWVYHGTKLFTWGGDIDAGEENDEIHLELVKLLLDESDRGEDIKRNVQANCDRTNLKVVDILADYLRGLLRHAAKRIDDIDANEKIIRVILSVPALWQPLAQQKMREACQAALMVGMVLKDQGERGIVSEPEAVAAFLMEKNPQLGIVKGDLIAVLDGGGGTSDIALLEITSTNPLQMNQAAPVDGIMRGSIFLDEGFEKLLRRRVSHLQSGSISRKKMESNIKGAVASFKNELKPRFGEFGGGELSVWFDGLQNDPDHNFTSNRVRFTEAEFRAIFDPVVHGNIELIVELLNGYKATMERENKPVKQVKYLFFVGGLSGSIYMEDAVRKYFWTDRRMGYPITIKTPSKDGATALVQGALLLAANASTIRDIRVPYGYAIVNDELYDESKHGTQVRRFLDPHDKRRMVKDRVKVLVQKEDVITDSHLTPMVTRSGPLFFEWVAGQPCVVDINLWRCSERVADHADLATLKSANVIAPAYTLTVDLEDAVDARQEMCNLGGKKGVVPLSEVDELEPQLKPMVTRSTSRFRAGLTELGSRNGTEIEGAQAGANATAYDLPRSRVGIPERRDGDESDPDTTGSNTGSSKSSNVTRRNTFFRYTYQVVVRIVGPELIYQVEAPPGGPVRQSTTLSITSE